MDRTAFHYVNTPLPARGEETRSVRGRRDEGKGEMMEVDTDIDR